MAGMACAVGLTLADREVLVVEQGLHAGGRMDGLRARGYEFDAGAQYFTVRDPLFRSQVDTWLAEQRVAPWHGWVVEVERGDFVNRDAVELFVAQPSMGALVRHLARYCDVRERTRVAAVRRERDQWRLLDSRGEVQARCRELVLAMPAPQGRALLSSEAPELTRRIEDFETAPCWAVMLGFEEALPVPFHAAYVNQSPLAWVARNSSKPGRASREAWVLHATPEWSGVHGDLGESEVVAHLLRALENSLDLQDLDPVLAEARYWPHATPIHTLGETFLRDGPLGLSLCGDWCLGPRVEAAYLSGHALAEHLVQS